MKTLKLYSVPGTTLAKSDDYDSLREFANTLGHSDIEIVKVEVKVFETGDKVKTQIYVGGNEDEAGITTGGKLVDFTGTIKVENKNLSFLTDENGKTISISTIVEDGVELIKTKTEETLYTADGSIARECLIGTREEWKFGNMDSFKSWYGDWVQENTPDMRIHDEERDGKIEELMTLNKWIEQTLDESLTEADEDEIAKYKRLDPITDFQD